MTGDTPTTMSTAATRRGPIAVSAVGHIGGATSEETHRRIHTTQASRPAADHWAKRVFAVTLFVDDVLESTRFYRDVFEMPILHQDEESTAFGFPNIVINLLATSSAPELSEPAPIGEAGTPARMMLTLQVDDVDAVCERLKARGAAPLNGPLDRPWGPRTATFADPSGHRWELSD